MEILQQFKELIPPLTNEEYKQLEANCLDEGIREPILTWNNYIIDGHNRYNIAQQWNLEFKTESKNFKGEDEVKEWMILNQFGRRNLSNYQRSVLALQLEDVFRTKAKDNQVRTLKNRVRQISDKQQIDTKKELSKVAAVSHDTIAKVKKIQEKAPEEIKAKLATGEVSINAAYKEIKKEEKKEAIQQERRKLAEEGSKKEIQIDFRLGDFEEVFADIKDGSVDCIITDPPYPKEFLECWTKLSRFAKRVLKPNGFCIAYSGQMHLPEVMKRMSENLDYYWTFSVYHEGLTQIVNGVNLICRWKPVLIFQNQKKKINNTFQDYFISEKREKNSHDWQQSLTGVSYLVEMFTNPNDLILEPFAGSGTTIKAAINKNRRIIASEINENTYNICKSTL